MREINPEFYDQDGYMSTESYRANCYKTVEYIQKSVSPHTGSTEVGLLYATLAVATSNLAVAAAILQRPQPDNGVV